MLINLSNHPSEFWPEKQLKATRKIYGEILDIKFPAVDPNGKCNYIKNLAEIYFNKCMNLLLDNKEKNNAVHIMGEMTFCFYLVAKLLGSGIKCIASTSERNSLEFYDKKFSCFLFRKFRNYSL